MNKRQELESIEFATSLTGLEAQFIHRCVNVGLVSESLTDNDMAELRRIRRLTELGVNLDGAEIIVRMRRRIRSNKNADTSVRTR